MVAHADAPAIDLVIDISSGVGRDRATGFDYPNRFVQYFHGNAAADALSKLASAATESNEREVAYLT